MLRVEIFIFKYLPHVLLCKIYINFTPCLLLYFLGLQVVLTKIDSSMSHYLISTHGALPKITAIRMK